MNCSRTVAASSVTAIVALNEENLGIDEFWIGKGRKGWRAVLRRWRAAFVDFLGSRVRWSNPIFTSHPSVLEGLVSTPHM
jgi:hypothetical protein